MNLLYTWGAAQAYLIYQISFYYGAYNHFEKKMHHTFTIIYHKWKKLKRKKWIFQMQRFYSNEAKCVSFVFFFSNHFEFEIIMHVLIRHFTCIKSIQNELWCIARVDDVVEKQCSRKSTSNKRQHFNVSWKHVLFSSNFTVTASS